MKFRQILIKATYIMAGLLVLVLIGLTLYQKRILNQDPRSTDRQAAITGNTDRNEMGDLDDQLETEQALRDELKKQVAGIQRIMVEDPAMKKSIQAGIEDQYALLFNTLALSPGKEETLKIILSKSTMDYIVLNPEVLNAVTAEEKALLQQRYDDLRRETQLRVEAILGSENYHKYQEYEDRTFSRKVVSGFAESLAPHNGLTESQMNELIEIIYGEAREVYTDIGYDPSVRLNFPVDMNPETVSKRMEITNRILFNAADRSRENSVRVSA